jgi:hypothetical protein
LDLRNHPIVIASLCEAIATMATISDAAITIHFDISYEWGTIFRKIVKTKAWFPLVIRTTTIHFPSAHRGEGDILSSPIFCLEKMGEGQVGVLRPLCL